MGQSDPIEDGFLAELPPGVSVESFVVVATPGALELMQAPATQVAAARFHARALKLLRRPPGTEPTWVVGKPGLLAEEIGDGGSTVRIPLPFEVWAIRDDNAVRPGVASITFLTPGEY